jgi:hypothetical protein
VLAQRREVEQAAVAAGTAVGIELVAFPQIAERSDRHGSLARSSAALIHLGDVLMMFGSDMGRPAAAGLSSVRTDPPLLPGRRGVGGRPAG